jgi:hypothetical protein
MNECCRHLFREAKKELEIKDKRIAHLEAEVTRVFEPTREFWNNQRKQEITILKTAVLELSEALESIAFPDEPEASTYKYWDAIVSKNALISTIVLDTGLARETLARYEELLKQIKEGGA